MTGIHYGRAMEPTKDDSTAADYSTLPPRVAIGDTVTSVDADRGPDPDDVRNADQHAALRDD